MVVCVIVMVVMMIVVIVTMAVIVASTVGPAFGLKGFLNLLECCSETSQHFFNHVVGADTESDLANFGREMAISQMPGKPHQLMAVLVTDFHERLGGGRDPKPGSVVELK